MQRRFKILALFIIMSGIFVSDSWAIRRDLVLLQIISNLKNHALTPYQALV